jgi:predicted  nucleic acid-binding Zn ribbon protein
MAAKALFKAFNIGRDMELQLQIDHLMNMVVPAGPSALPNFDISELGLLKTFKCDPVFETIKVDAINLGGGETSRDEYKSWDGRFVIIRQTAATDYLMQVLQDACLAGAGQVTGTVTQYVYDSRGPATGIVKKTWANATIKPESDGEWQANNPVEQSFTFVAPKRDLEDVTSVGGSALLSALSTLGGALKILQ